MKVKFRGHLATILVALTTGLSVAVSGFGEQSDVEFALRGPAFTPGAPDPALVSPEWIHKKISYPKAVGHLDLRIQMDQNLFDALTPIIENYAKEKNLRVQIEKGTCGTSSGPIERKEADMAGFCCPPAPYDRLPGIVFHTIGIVPTVLITHPDNPVGSVSFGEVQKIYAGKIRSWKELSDPKSKSMTGSIQPVARLHCETRPGHWRDILDNKNLFFQQTIFVASIPDMVDAVAANPNAFGWVSRWVVENQANKGRVKFVKLGGVDPDDTQAVAQGRYPYFKVMNLTTWEGAAAKPQANQVIDYLLNQFNQVKQQAFIVHASQLRQNKWIFSGNELIGMPAK
ncbi:MAG: substrate-binding domain-containing protein [Magnetococcus sp. DMHC-1]|nr:substrate-binding domain-containing protein [Magnetococcales bacterium]